MGNRQTALEYAKDKLQQGLINSAEANVLAIQIEGVREVRGKIPREVRNALNKAVKDGKLGHLKKEGLKPECYFHVNSRYKAVELRNRAERRAMDSMLKVYAPPV